MNHPSNQQDAELESIFTYHPPVNDQPKRYVNVRDAAKVFAQVIVDNCPACADRTAAIRKIREAVFVANASIALEPVALSSTE